MSRIIYESFFEIFDESFANFKDGGFPKGLSCLEVLGDAQPSRKTHFILHVQFSLSLSELNLEKSCFQIASPWACSLHLSVPSLGSAQVLKRDRNFVPPTHPGGGVAGSRASCHVHVWA